MPYNADPVIQFSQKEVTEGVYCLTGFSTSSFRVNILHIVINLFLIIGAVSLSQIKFLTIWIFVQYGEHRSRVCMINFVNPFVCARTDIQMNDFFLCALADIHMNVYSNGSVATHRYLFNFNTVRLNICREYVYRFVWISNIWCNIEYYYVCVHAPMRSVRKVYWLKIY